MGFRNPITTAVDPVARASAAAAQQTADSAYTEATTGIVPGSRLAADAIDGRTITGATLRTAASGQRVQIDSTSGLVGYNAAGQAVTQVRTSDGVLTAAGAQITGTIDTGVGGTNVPGVKLYTVVESTTSAYGAVEFRDGVVGDLPAQVIGKADYSQTANSATVGGGLRLVGGKYRTVVAPELDLNVEPDGAGGYFSVARLKGAPTLDLGGAKLTNLAFGSLDDTGWAAMPLGAGYTIGADGASWRRWGQFVEFQIHALGGANGTLFTFPSWAWTSRAHWWVPEWGGVAVGEVKLATNGVLSVSARSASAGFVVSGSYLIG